MKRLNLRGFKLTIIGAAITVCGTEEALLFYVGLVVMILGLFAGDKIETRENDET